MSGTAEVVGLEEWGGGVAQALRKSSANRKKFAFIVIIMFVFSGSLQSAPLNYFVTSECPAKLCFTSSALLNGVFLFYCAVKARLSKRSRLIFQSLTLCSKLMLPGTVMYSFKNSNPAFASVLLGAGFRA